MPNFFDWTVWVGLSAVMWYYASAVLNAPTYISLLLALLFFLVIAIVVGWWPRRWTQLLESWTVWKFVIGVILLLMIFIGVNFYEIMRPCTLAELEESSSPHIARCTKQLIKRLHPITEDARHKQEIVYMEMDAEGFPGKRHSGNPEDQKRADEFLKRLDRINEVVVKEYLDNFRGRADLLHEELSRRTLPKRGPSYPVVDSPAYHEPKHLYDIQQIVLDLDRLMLQLPP